MPSFYVWGLQGLSEPCSGMRWSREGSRSGSGELTIPMLELVVVDHNCPPPGALVGWVPSRILVGVAPHAVATRE